MTLSELECRGQGFRRASVPPFFHQESKDGHACTKMCICIFTYIYIFLCVYIYIHSCLCLITRETIDLLVACELGINMDCTNQLRQLAVGTSRHTS